MLCARGVCVCVCVCVYVCVCELCSGVALAVDVSKLNDGDECFDVAMLI